MNNALILESDDTNNLVWCIDKSLAVHIDIKSHMLVVFTMVKGEIISSSTKQKLNSQNSTYSEWIGMDYKIAKVIFMQRFLQYQGFPVKLNIILLNNTSSIKLEENGK